MPHIKYKIKQKRLIIAEAHQPGAFKKAVARKHGVQATHIRRWTANFNACTLELLHDQMEIFILNLFIH